MLPQVTTNRDQIPIRGAHGYILRVLCDRAVDGVCSLSIQAIAELSGYSTGTVVNALRYLSTNQIIQVARERVDRRNNYYLVGV